LATLSARALAGIPEIRPGDDLGGAIFKAAGPGGLRPGHVLAIAHTVVSKAEGAIVRLSTIEPSPRAVELGLEQGKDPRIVQVALEESAEILRAEHGVLISRTHHGFVCANAGVDSSNAPEPDQVVLLPADPDASARGLRARLAELAGVAPAQAPAVLITDSFGRAWRNGQTDIAIGLAGMAPLDDWRGRTDANGLRLQATWLAVADAAAGAADLVRAKDSGEPVVLLEGLERFVCADDGPGALALLRPAAEDLFS
jgi:coenzyme F420-0:L-glutamate ligase / coenzyme F420-1:gamma-L-glutamate ligase